MSIAYIIPVFVAVAVCFSVGFIVYRAVMRATKDSPRYQK